MGAFKSDKRRERSTMGNRYIMGDKVSEKPVERIYKDAGKGRTKWE